MGSKNPSVLVVQYIRTGLRIHLYSVYNPFDHGVKSQTPWCIIKSTAWIIKFLPWIL